MSDTTIMLDPDDERVAGQLETLQEFVMDFHDGDGDDDALATFLVNAGRTEMYRRMREIDAIPEGWNPDIESRMELPNDNDEIRGFQ